MNKLVSNYIKLVDFLADFLGEDTEVLLHDLTNPENSVVAIRNGHISGRDIGAPATDLALKIMKNAKYNDVDYLSNYQGTSKFGKILKSATYIIKENDGTIVGMLCINMDVEKAFEMRKFLDTMLNFENDKTQDKNIVETYSKTAYELTFDNIYKVIGEFRVEPERMDQNEKIKVIDLLNEDGTFLIKGAVSETAKALKVSEATIYRYLSKIKRNSRRAGTEV